MNSNIILFTTHCPKCNVLKKKLDSDGIAYETVTDIDYMTSIGIQSAPMLKVYDKMLDFIQAVKFINEGGLK